MPVLHHIRIGILLAGIGVILFDGCKSSKTAVDPEMLAALKGGEVGTGPDSSLGNVRVVQMQMGRDGKGYLPEWDDYPGATDIYPNTLYSGPNVVTVRNDNGISSIAVRSGTDDVKWSVEGDGVLSDCPTEHDLVVNVGTVTRFAQILVEVVDCHQNENAEWVQLQNRIWTLDRINFPDVRVGERACRPFRITITGWNPVAGSYILDSISFPPGLPLEVEEELEFPVAISEGGLFYTVCFTGRVPGDYTFPVTTWMRRDQPAGGYTTYAIADTGHIRVLQ